jgi:hypothetical protein
MDYRGGREILRQPCGQVRDRLDAVDPGRERRQPSGINAQVRAHIYRRPTAIHQVREKVPLRLGE